MCDLARSPICPLISCPWALSGEWTNQCGLLVTIEGHQTLATVKEYLLELLRMHIQGASLQLFQDSLKGVRLLKEWLECRWPGAVSQSWNVAEGVWVSLWPALSLPISHCHPQSHPDGSMGFDLGAAFIFCCVQEVSTRIQFPLQRALPSVALIPKLKWSAFYHWLNIAIT